MRKFEIPNLCGVSASFNKLAKQFSDSISILTDNLEADASALVSSLSTGFDKLEANLRAMIPKLPSIPAINLQAEIKALAGLVPGSSAYLSKLASIIKQFGSVLPDIESLVKSALATILSGGNICKTVPNWELPDGATDAVQKAQSVVQANVAPVVETIQEWPKTIAAPPIIPVHDEELKLWHTDHIDAYAKREARLTADLNKVIRKFRLDVTGDLPQPGTQAYLEP